MKSLSGYVGRCIGGPKHGETMASPFDIVHVSDSAIDPAKPAIGVYQFSTKLQIWQWQGMPAPGQIPPADARTSE